MKRPALLEHYSLWSFPLDYAWAFLGFGTLIATLFGQQSQHITFPCACLFFLVGVLCKERFGALENWEERLPDHSLFIAGTLFLSLCFISLLWSPVPSRGFGVALSLAGLGACALIAALLRPFLLRPIAGFALVFGVLSVGALFLFEARTGLALRGLMGLDRELSTLNRGAVTLSLFALIALAWLLQRRFFAMAIAVVGFNIFVLLHLSSGAALFGLIAGLTAMILFSLLPKLFAPFFLGAWLFVLLSAPWFFSMLARALPASVQATFSSAHLAERLEIWDAFSAVILQSSPSQWLIGRGFEASVRAGQEADILSPLMGRPLEAGHPHNVALQVWYELGLLGVGAAAFVVFCLFQLMRRASPSVRLAIYGLSSALSVIALTSHGAWQPWWVATFGLCFLGVQVLVQEPTNR